MNQWRNIFAWDVKPDAPSPPSPGTRVQIRSADGVGMPAVIIAHNPDTTWRDTTKHGDLWVQFDDGSLLGYPASHWYEVMDVVD